MDSTAVTTRLDTELARAARRRQELGQELVPVKDFEQFIKAVELVSRYGMSIAKEVPDIRHIGMALNYYNAAIKYVIDEQVSMAEAINVAA